MELFKLFLDFLNSLTNTQRYSGTNLKRNYTEVHPNHEFIIMSIYNMGIFYGNYKLKISSNYEILIKNIIFMIL